MTARTFRTQFRAMRMGLQTVLGGKRRGWFIPYRYAATVSEPAGYPALEPVFDAARSRFSDFFDRMEMYADALVAFGNDPAPQPRWRQGWFPRLDAAAAYTMVRDRKPRNILEIGSGHSTRFMARAVSDGSLETRIVAVDPAPRAAIVGIGVEHIASTLNDADPAHFDGLAPGDILFIDSSHILMPGTDVDYLLNTVWPRLPTGVIVHIHDILLPDGYPAEWEWRGYNEQSAVAPLIAGEAAKLLFASRFAATRMADRMNSGIVGRLELFDGAIETSLWIEKL